MDSPLVYYQHTGRMMLSYIPVRTTTRYQVVDSAVAESFRLTPSGGMGGGRGGGKGGTTHFSVRDSLVLSNV